jgi:hypothetical protein
MNDTVTTTNTITNGEFLVTLTNAGEFYDAILDGPVEFQSSGPIQVAQFAQGGNTDSFYGDPCEILLPAAGNYLSSYTVPIPDNNEAPDLTNSFLNIIVPASATNATSLDGSVLSATNFINLFSNGYVGARLSVTNGAHTIASSQPFELEVYGFGRYDAYSFIAGSSIGP